MGTRSTCWNKVARKWNCFGGKTPKPGSSELALIGPLERTGPPRHHSFQLSDKTRGSLLEGSVNIETTSEETRQQPAETQTSATALHNNRPTELPLNLISPVFWRGVFVQVLSCGPASCADGFHQLGARAEGRITNVLHQPGSVQTPFGCSAQSCDMTAHSRGLALLSLNISFLCI